jgi:hypothetical protein
MALTDKQRKAIEFIADNPEARPEDIAGGDGRNAADFIWRLLTSGKVVLDLSPETRDAIEDGTL